MIRFNTLWLALVLVSSSLSAESFEISSKHSSLGFSGKHVGREFSGIFTKWHASLSLPSSVSDLSTNAGFIRAEFTTASAHTGNSLYDETLIESDWFNVEDYPIATFESEQIERDADNYKVFGQLTIKDKTLPIEFTLKPTSKGLEGDFIVNRLDFNIGVESDPDAEWVSKAIKLKLVIVR